MDGAGKDDAHIPNPNAFFFIRDSVVDGPFCYQENLDVAVAVAIHIDVGIDHGVERNGNIGIFANRLAHCLLLLYAYFVNKNEPIRRELQRNMNIEHL